MAHMAVSVAPSPHVLFAQDYECHDQLGRNPLQQRFIWGFKDDAERLAAFEEMLDEFPKQKNRRQMLFKTVGRGDEVIARRLVETGMQVVPDLDAERLYNEAKEKREAETGEMEVEEDIPDVDDPSCSPLHVATSHEQFGILKMFIESGEDVNALDEIGRTPLIAASHRGHVEIMAYLLGRGADLMVRMSTNAVAQEYLDLSAGADALEVVTLNGTVEGLKLLLEHHVHGTTGNNADHGDSEKRLTITTRAIHNAARGSYEALVYLFTKAGYPLPSRDGGEVGEQLTEEQKHVILDAIPMTASFGPLACLKMLLSYFFIGHEVENGTFAVREAWHETWTRGAYGSLEKHDEDKLAYLYWFGIKEHDTMSMDPLPESQTLNLQHLLELAAQQGSMKCARLLIVKYGAGVNKMRVPPASFPLFLATWRDRADMVRYLLEDCGADVHKGILELEIPGIFGTRASTPH